MTDRHKSLPAADPLQEALAQHLSPTAMARLQQIIDHSRGLVDTKMTIEQTIDVAFDVMLSGELQAESLRRIGPRRVVGRRRAALARQCS